MSQKKTDDKVFYIYYSDKNLEYLQKKKKISCVDDITKTLFKHTNAKDIRIQKITTYEYKCN